MKKLGEPWSTNQGCQTEATADFSGVRKVRFRVKGDGGKYRFDLPRDAVKDYGNFATSFKAPDKWTTVEIRVDSLRQPDWAAQLPRTWTDVRTIEIERLDEAARILFLLPTTWIYACSETEEEPVRRASICRRSKSIAP